MSPTGTAVFVLATTGAYSLSRVAAKRFPSPFTTPVFFGTAVVIAILMLGGFSVTDYDGAKSIITYLLGPATVALTVPLYKNRKTLIGNMAPVMAGLLAGSVSTLIAAVTMAKALGFSPLVVSSISTKSVSAPIAIELAPLIHADPSLAAVFVVITGMFGAMAGPFILSEFRIRDPLARGLSLGVISHGQGTAQAITEGELQGAGAGIAMGLTALWAPLMAPTLLRIFA